MSQRFVVYLPEGVTEGHPEVKRLFDELQKVKPLPKKQATRDELSNRLHRAYESASMGADVCLIEADTAIAFFLEILKEASDTINSRRNEDTENNARQFCAIDALYMVKKALTYDPARSGSLKVSTETRSR